jgi:hypothetical protein
MPQSPGTPTNTRNYLAKASANYNFSPPQTKSKKDREVIPKPGISLSKRKKRKSKKKGNIFSPHRASIDPNSNNVFNFQEMSPAKKALLNQIQKLNAQIERE